MADEHDPRHSQRSDGPTPAGGAYAIGYFMDRTGKPCTRDEMVSMEIHEFDAHDQCIMRTYSGPALFTPPSDD